jgi:hypothetical protein
MPGHQDAVRPHAETGRVAQGVARRVTFALALLSALLVSRPGLSFWDFPALTRPWALVPFAMLFLAAVIDLDRLWSLRNLDLLALLTPALALATWTRSGEWQFVFLYVPLAFLLVRMTFVAGLWSRGSATRTPDVPFRAYLPVPWLVGGVLGLVVVHVLWTLDTSLSSDIGLAGVHGAQSLLKGRPIYGAGASLHAAAGRDLHLDSYGPLAYEAVAPFTWLLDGMSAARLATLFFDLSTMLALFALGKRARDASIGLTLALAWLAFPFSLYVAELGANDGLLSASLVLTLMCAQTPARRGGALALAAWSKLTPLALLPLMAGRGLDRQGSLKRTVRFGSSFLLVSALIFLPVLVHGSLATFVERTFGFQSSRAPAYSIWEVLDGSGVGVAAHIAGAVVRGLLAAGTGVLAIGLSWRGGRRDLTGVAAASAAVLIGLVIVDGYFSFTYICWFAPLVLAATLLDDGRSSDPCGPSVSARKASGEVTESGLPADPSPRAPRRHARSSSESGARPYQPV